MAKMFNELAEAHIAFINTQKIFFVGTAAAQGRVNISPKGMDSLRVMSPTRLVWRNLTGSGNETAGHLRAVNRITLMWAGFEARPMILRVYGSARTLHPRDAEFEPLNAAFPESNGARQIFDVAIDAAQSSCGYAVPFFDFAGERDTLSNWAAAKEPEDIARYWSERNQQTIDGLPTGVDVDDIRDGCPSREPSR